MNFKISSLMMVLVGCLPMFAGAVSKSANYRVSHQVFDSGGGQATSANYKNHGSIGGSGGLDQDSENYPARSGFIGQIHDAPIISIGTATNLTRTDGTIQGSVNPNSLDSVAWFELGPVGEFTDLIPLDDFGSDTVEQLISVLVDSLEPGTDYQFRLVASNADGTVHSPIEYFSTVVNLPPTADPVTIERLRDLSARILLSDLLEGASDPEGDSISLETVATTSANGGQIFVSGGWVLYQPPSGFNGDDRFTYTIRDSFGAETVAMVDVVIRGSGNEPTLNVRSIEQLPATGGHVRIRFAGVPGRTYEIQATENLADGWQELGTVTADSVGLYEFIDEDAADF